MDISTYQPLGHKWPSKAKHLKSKKQVGEQFYCLQANFQIARYISFNLASLTQQLDQFKLVNKSILGVWDSPVEEYLTQEHSALFGPCPVKWLQNDKPAQDHLLVNSTFFDK